VSTTALRVRCARAILCALCVLACVLGGAGVASLAAHEIGKTQVTASFSKSSYTIDIVIDPDALLQKLEALGGAPAAGTPPRAERDRRIAALGGVFLDRMAVELDGRADRPRLEYLPASRLGDAAQAPSIVRLTGDVPAGARRFVFANGLALGAYAVNLRIGDAPTRTIWASGPERIAPVALDAVVPPLTIRQVAFQYLGLGYTHILPFGTDHILFVVGIFLLSSRWRSVLLQVSTFTLAHSITLALTMYGLVSLPARVVEPMIALSIVYVAIENLITGELKPWRLALVFSFGLLHGMGFAGVLRDVGLPRSQFLAALVSFNVGVEAGQLSVIAMALAMVVWWRRNQATYRRIVVRPASLVIALIGLFWTIQRVILT
jgi:hydrogenase/urease accessory protein HupE